MTIYCIIIDIKEGDEQMGEQMNKKNFKKRQLDKGRVDELLARAHRGETDSQIARDLKVHRTTVKRYRESAEREDLFRQARIAVVQQALLSHFSDLSKVLETTDNELRIPSPEYVAYADIDLSGGIRFTVHHYNRGSVGGSVGLSWTTQKGKGVELCIPVENEILFSCFKQHTKGAQFWKFIQAWKEKGGQYLLQLSDFLKLLKEEAEQKTGLITLAKPSEEGLTQYFAGMILDDACGHAFFNNKGLEGVTYEIRSPKPDWHELECGSSRIAHSSIKERLQQCEWFHKEMLDQHRDPNQRASQLEEALKLWAELKELEAKIHSELERLRLKRIFPGRCDLCPD